MNRIHSQGTHRRFSLQPFKASHHSHKRGGNYPPEHEGPEATEVSRTPEESTASFEGPSTVQPDGPSVYAREGDSGTAKGKGS